MLKNKQNEENTKNEDTLEENSAASSVEEVKSTGSDHEAENENENRIEEQAEPDLAEEIEILQEKIDQSEEKYLRLIAEFENYKKRTRLENEQRLKYSDIPLAKGLINNIDNLERALDHSKKLEQTPTTDEIIKGLEMISKQFIECLAERNILKIDTVGQDFDPEVHEAIGTVESNEYEEGKIVSVIKSGYKIFDRIICPAVVQVSKKTPVE